MSLTTADPHHWAPIPAIVDWLTNRLPPEAKVLEIGPGHAPFYRANEFVDFNPGMIVGIPNDKIHNCDIATEPLPFQDKSFDFIYCRHTLEDMWNPFHLCKEMERVGRAGYIETPSPIAELCRGVDGGAPPYRGYHHHRWVVWAAADELCFVSKYPIIEYIDIDDMLVIGHDNHEWLSENLLRSAIGRYWNTYYLWDNSIHVRHWQSPLDYDIPREYRSLLMRAAQTSAFSINAFWSNISDDSLRKSA